MTPTERMERIEKISIEVHNIANSFSGEETGAIAYELHAANNCIFEAQRMFKDGITSADRHRQMLEWIKKQPIYSTCNIS